MLPLPQIKNNRCMRTVYTVVFTLCALCVFGQNVLQKGKDVCFDSDIKSIQLCKSNSSMTDPIIQLHSDETLSLTFDDLSEKGRNFVGKIVLCDADWNESNLFSSEYIMGFPDCYINTWQSSFNTLVSYLHYSLTFPNEQMQIKLSGNYLLKIYDSNDAERVLFQKSFSVVETSKIAMSVNIRTAPTVATSACAQRLEISVSHSQVPIRDPHRELKVRVQQNGYNIASIQPPTILFTRQYVLDYTQLDKNWYPAGSEYRHFDISSLEYKTLRVRHIENVNNVFNVLLEEDMILKQYLSYKDLNGRYIVRNERYQDNSNTESDYANVFFTLKSPKPLAGKVYVFGELSDWQLHNDFVMLYNQARGAYELSVLLKQAYYNYKYVYVDENGKVDIGKFDACSVDAENTYGVFLYLRTPSDRHDRLINVAFINTQQDISR
ncbi:MAG: DUF5103 domain-containing protein [Bacteroidales bacterium]